MATVTISFNFSRGLETDNAENEFDVDTDIVGCIEEFAEEWCNNRNDDEECDDLWIFDGHDVVDFEVDYTDQQGPHDFDNLTDWAEYCEAADDAERSHSDGGTAYCVRYADIGEFDMDSDYMGFYDSLEEFAESVFDDFEACPKHLRQYIDFDAYANDLGHDYSTYEVNGNVYVFRDC